MKAVSHKVPTGQCRVYMTGYCEHSETLEVGSMVELLHEFKVASGTVNNAKTKDVRLQYKLVDPYDTVADTLPCPGFGEQRHSHTSPPS